ITLTIVGRTLLGSEVAEDTRVVSEALPVLLEGVNQRILSSMPPAFHKLPSLKNSRMKRAAEALNQIVLRIIGERRALSAEENDSRHDLLSMLMAARDEDTGEGMTDQQLRDEIMTIFLAGHETTANLLAWTFFLLSRHPAIEKKLRAEISSVMDQRTPGPEDLMKMPYGTMVLEESLRLYPPAWVIAREAKSADKIGGFTIPAGAIMVLSPYVMHRVPKYWENPEGFDPERFREEEVAKRPKFAWFPFGGGPRLCIGNAFAMMEAQLILTMVLQKFRLDLVPGHIVTPEALITLRPKYGVQMTLHRM
ncbi:MAG: cytochrome P450, partial [Bdellovibrionota bacterium]